MIEMSNNLSELDKGWSITKLEDLVIKFVGGGTPSKQNSAYYQGNIPWMTVKDMTTRRPHVIVDNITLEAVTNSATNLIPPDTIIIATRMSLGKVVRVPFEVAINQDLKALILSKDVDKDFIEYWLLTRASHLQTLGTGTTVKGIRLEVLKQLEVFLPPLNEQRRIVAKIEAVKARSQQVKEALEAIPSLLEQFRQSVLAAAFRGDLTADWREKNPDVEPASVLLERIRRDRQQNKAKNKKQEEINLTNLPELPKSWCWASLGEVSAIQGGIQKQPKRVPNKNAYPFLRVANVPRGGLNLDNVHQIELFGNELEKLRLHKGDLLIVEGNGSPSEIGRMAIWDGSIKDCVHQNHLIRVRLDKGLMPEFVEAYWNSPHGRFRVFDVAHTTTGLYTLSVSKIAKLPVPFAPEAEQVVLMQILEKLFKIETYVQAIIRQSEDELDSLDQSILAKAFRGELVPQDPNDEPASTLLERIRAERDKQETAAKTAKKSTTKTSGKRRKKTQQQDSESVQLGLPGLE
jgi:type I restriction enzyme, S subunit